MTDTIVDSFLILGILLCAFSSVAFMAVRKSEYPINRLMQHTIGHWYKNLHDIVPEKWVRPIYWSSFLGVFIAMSAVIFSVASTFFLYP